MLIELILVTCHLYFLSNLARCIHFIHLFFWFCCVFFLSVGFSPFYAINFTPTLFIYFFSLTLDLSILGWLSLI